MNLKKFFTKPWVVITATAIFFYFIILTIAANAMDVYVADDYKTFTNLNGFSCIGIEGVIQEAFIQGQDATTSKRAWGEIFCFTPISDVWIKTNGTIYFFDNSSFGRIKGDSIDKVMFS